MSKPTKKTAKRKTVPSKDSYAGIPKDQRKHVELTLLLWRYKGNKTATVADAWAFVQKGDKEDAERKEKEQQFNTTAPTFERRGRKITERTFELVEFDFGEIANLMYSIIELARDSDLHQAQAMIEAAAQKAGYLADRARRRIGNDGPLCGDFEDWVRVGFSGLEEEEESEASHA
jgi:hypothetical protein